VSFSHAHNAESIAELRKDIGEEGAAVGEPDALSTHAQLLAEKRIGFLLLTLGLVLYLSGVVLKSPEGLAMMGFIAGGCRANQPRHQCCLYPGGWQPDTRPGRTGHGAARPRRAARAVVRVRRQLRGEGSCCGPAFRSRSVTSRCGPAPQGPGWRSFGPRQWPGGWLGRAQPGGQLVVCPAMGPCWSPGRHFHLSLTINRRDRAA
jgi:hypothetical protein